MYPVRTFSIIPTRLQVVLFQFLISALQNNLHRNLFPIQIYAVVMWTKKNRHLKMTGNLLCRQKYISMIHNLVNTVHFPISTWPWQQTYLCDSISKTGDLCKCCVIVLKINTSLLSERCLHSFNKLAIDSFLAIYL